MLTLHIASLDQLDADNLNLMRGFVTAKVADHLKTELEAFVNHCYIPVGKKAASIGKVFNSDTSRSHLDLSYIGNQHYLLGKGLYQYCSESECEFSMAHTEYNMPYEFASRITPKFDLIQNVTLPDGTTTTQTILPSCYVWWVGRGDSVYPAGDLGFSASRIPNDHLGLRDQLFISSDFGQGAVDRVNVFNDLSLSARDRFNDSRYRDAVVHRALINTYEGRLTTRTRATDADRSTTDKVLDLAGLTAAGGLASLGYVFSKILYMALPPFLEITHALLKLVVIFGSMIVILIGGMNITVALKTTIYVMTVYSFEILWHILDTIKAKLIPYIYGVSSISDVPSPGLLPGAGGSLLGHAIFEIVMVLSYLAIPGVFVAYLAVAGANKVGQIGEATAGNVTAGKKF
ncbi:hypothetical protein P8S54_07685 [Thiomicrospira sp. R3]|uniref:hypothetical protein n=1 Tax=Thiomicrospira sp. R3 TaxID=3035472 RepID=UPI00259BDE55|nr:hypothetical protein [Thiomicrospira sp. R3]WFE68103.1 hypothetical protein P8S54_07685 [Thiomicrospira sp. R3]